MQSARRSRPKGCNRDGCSEFERVYPEFFQRWLKAGVMEKSTVRFPEEECPRGGVIPPLLSNIYPHEVLRKNRTCYLTTSIKREKTELPSVNTRQ